MWLEHKRACPWPEGLGNIPYKTALSHRVAHVNAMGRLLESLIGPHLGASGCFGGVWGRGPRAMTGPHYSRPWIEPDDFLIHRGLMPQRSSSGGSRGLVQVDLCGLRFMFVDGFAREIEELPDGPLLFVGAFRRARLEGFLGS